MRAKNDWGNANENMSVWMEDLNEQLSKPGSRFMKKDQGINTKDQDNISKDKGSQRRGNTDRNMSA